MPAWAEMTFPSEMIFGQFREKEEFMNRIHNKVDDVKLFKKGSFLSDLISIQNCQS